MEGATLRHFEAVPDTHELEVPGGPGDGQGKGQEDDLPQKTKTEISPRLLPVMY